MFIQSSSPPYLSDLVTLQRCRSTWSSTLVTFLQPSVNSSLKTSNRSFRHAAPHVWNKIPPTLRDHYHHHSAILHHQALIMDRLLTFSCFPTFILKLSFSHSISTQSHLCLAQTDLMELTTRYLAVTGGDNISEYGSWRLGAL